MSLKLRFESFLEDLGGLTQLTLKTLKATFSRPFYFSLFIEQLSRLVVDSSFLVTITALATGSVMALQYAFGLEKFGGKMYVPRIVCLSFVREMGPVFTSLLLAGRIGSGIAAEVASMKVTQQIDALTALGTSPIRKIVVPRVLAVTLGLPLLTIFSDIIGLFGGMLVCMSEVGITSEYYISRCIESLRPVDFYTGLIKALVFALYISLCACYKGMSTKGGTEGVGNTTTSVVVSASIFIMISDFFLTKILLMVMPYAQ